MMTFLLSVGDEMIYMGDEDSFVVTDAEPVSKYSFRLRYTTEGDESPYSNPVHVETPESGIIRCSKLQVCSQDR
jgi:hypothetical protein